MYRGNTPARTATRERNSDHRAKARNQSTLAYAHTVSDRTIGKKVLLSFLALTLVLLGGAVIVSPLYSAAAICLVFTALIALQAFLRVLAVLNSKNSFDINTAAASITHWPRYTVLVPLKDEAHMVRELVNKLSCFDYPEDRLQILLIVEEDDPATRRAAMQNLRPPFDCIVVPRTEVNAPRTKPYALNYAMRFARGELITIYDAEDHPHPQQLKTAVQAFNTHPNWGALQAPLDYFNAYETQLSRQFALEYAAQFHVWIPLMARLGLPFPLGGTSNHIRKTALEDIRQKAMYWDSYNVTEDADLSFRLSAKGWDIGYITPPTDEEAVAQIKPWGHQRTRWMKGFMQSWLVHMDAPLLPGGKRGLMRQFTLQITLGTVLLAGFLHTPICLAALGWTLFQLMSAGSVSYPSYVYISLLLGYGSGIMMGCVGAYRCGKPRLMLSAIFMPFYWLLLWVPTWRALYEYSKRPFYWAKTTHGVTTDPAPNVHIAARQQQNSAKPEVINGEIKWPQYSSRHGKSAPALPDKALAARGAQKPLAKTPSKPTAAK